MPGTAADNLRALPTPAQLCRTSFTALLEIRDQANASRSALQQRTREVDALLRAVDAELFFRRQATAIRSG